MRRDSGCDIFLPPATHPGAAPCTGCVKMTDVPVHGSPRSRAVDVLRGLTIMWITAFHFYADTRGGPGPLTSSMFTRALEQMDPWSMMDMTARTLIALPSYRLDVFLAVTGLVLALSRPVPAIAFWRVRARAIFPNYWCGSIAAALLLVGLALLRSSVRGTAPALEISDGTLLGRGLYHFEWVDVVRSLSVVGRLQDTRTMQVVAPSLWYVLLAMQLYLVFPLLRWLMNRLGRWLFLGICLATMCLARQYVLNGGWLWPGFGASGTLIYFLPFRLLGPALGMVAATWVRPAGLQPSRSLSVALFGPAVALVLWTTWYGADSARDGIFGTALPLVLGLPALWTIASGLLHVPSGAAIITWIGRHSLSVLVVQDLLRLITGTTIALWGRLDALTWYLLPFYLVAVVALTPLWHAVPEAAAALVGWHRERTGR